MSRSGTLRRDVRLDRQELDEGADGDLVIVVWSSGSKHYHEDPDCRHLANVDDVDTVPRSTAKARWKAPCGSCVAVLEGSE